ncbi:MAG: hypothetical protein DDT26_01979 [Dehalococcoidia bacterium]|nr:hypothetical protein [Chloroflexota bacterium]
MVHYDGLSIQRRHWLQLGLVSALAASFAKGSSRSVINFTTEIDANTLANGRLIFRGTRSREGRVVSWFDEQSEFTHVGILINQLDAKDHWNVIHATPDHAKVVQERLEDFLKIPSLFSAAVFQWNLPSPISESDISQQATQWIGTPFDGGFDFYNQDLYCTELVWKAAQSLNWVDEPKLTTLKTPFGAKRVLMIGDLLKQLPLIRLS